MKLGVVGLPNVGKSTLFNALTHARAESANYPFCTIEPNIGIVPVPDPRLDVLAQMYNTLKVTPATLEFVDIAGLVKGASNGEGLGNKFLSHIREVDAIIHVVRCFDNPNIIHVDGDVQPARDIQTINLELILADIQSLEKQIAKITRQANGGDKLARKTLEAYQIVMDTLNQGLPARQAPLDADQVLLLRDAFLITSKPVIYVANVSPDQLQHADSDPHIRTVFDIAHAQHSIALSLCADIEAELSTLPPEDIDEYMREFGISQLGLDQLIQASYQLLGLISFLTAGEKECRAWTIRRGTLAPAAAGVIHTDFQRGFIKAEVINYHTLVACGSYQSARESGKVRMEGKDYVVQDGDVILFRFNV